MKLGIFQSALMQSPFAAQVRQMERAKRPPAILKAERDLAVARVLKARRHHRKVRPLVAEAQSAAEALRMAQECQRRIVEEAIQDIRRRRQERAAMECIQSIRERREAQEAKRARKAAAKARKAA